VVDSRKQPKKTIIKLELLKDEFEVAKCLSVLNKVGYNPSKPLLNQKIWSIYTQKNNSLDHELYKEKQCFHLQSWCC
jgi:hypothetical protein